MSNFVFEAKRFWETAHGEVVDWDVVLRGLRGREANSFDSLSPKRAKRMAAVGNSSRHHRK